MTVKQCDRCKAIYRPSDLLTVRINVNKILPPEMQYKENPKEYDLCEKCSSEFCAFMAQNR